jgi:hypothetical protein
MARLTITAEFEPDEDDELSAEYGPKNLLETLVQFGLDDVDITVDEDPAEHLSVREILSRPLEATWDAGEQARQYALLLNQVAVAVGLDMTFAQTTKRPKR